MLDINTTPLIDVMLVLLIMLIVTIPPRTHAVNLELPAARAAATAPPAVVRLAIDFDGSMTWNGVPVPDRAALESRLRAAAAMTPQPELHVAPNNLVKYDYVAMVLAESQRLGIVKLGIVAGGEDAE